MTQKVMQDTYRDACLAFQDAKYGYEPLLTNAQTTGDQRCRAEYHGERCQRPAGHIEAGMGMHQTSMRAVEWLDGEG